VRRPAPDGATAAIGPGFVTQTRPSTAQPGAAFAFSILVAIFIDVALQLNVWRVIGVSTSSRSRRWLVARWRGVHHLSRRNLSHQSARPVRWMGIIPAHGDRNRVRSTR
jgi:hypothetical protein